MRITDEIAKANEDRIRRIVREEIARAFGALGREAESQDMPYETGEIEAAALRALKNTAEGTVTRLTCDHPSYGSWYNGRDPRCSRCGEPEPQPVNPFETEEDSRG